MPERPLHVHDAAWVFLYPSRGMHGEVEVCMAVCRAEDVGDRPGRSRLVPGRATHQDAWMLGAGEACHRPGRICMSSGRPAWLRASNLPHEVHESRPETSEHLRAATPRDDGGIISLEGIWLRIGQSTASFINDILSDHLPYHNPGLASSG